MRVRLLLAFVLLLEVGLSAAGYRGRMNSQGNGECSQELRTPMPRSRESRLIASATCAIAHGRFQARGDAALRVDLISRLSRAQPMHISTKGRPLQGYLRQSTVSISVVRVSECMYQHPCGPAKALASRALSARKGKRPSWYTALGAESLLPKNYLNSLSGARAAP